MKCIIFAAAAVISWSCSPVSISRIGPPLVSRGEGCEVQILEKDDLPNRPYRDVGMVTLDNCQDHRVPLCSNWLKKAVCELGGSFAYPVQETGTGDAADYFPNDDLTAAGAHMMTVRMMVGAYVVDLVTDPLYESDCETSQEALGNGPGNGGDKPQKCLE